MFLSAAQPPCTAACSRASGAQALSCRARVPWLCKCFPVLADSLASNASFLFLYCVLTLVTYHARLKTESLR